ncbi:Polyisoprenyl-teichoic acid--peptidoglycan teichoic acid transferase TagU [Streptomyces fumanus]
MLWTGGTMAFVVLVGAGVGYVYLKHLEGNVTTTDIGSAGKSSFSKDEAFNILLLGTDKRTGAGNEGYGDKGSSGHADTTILLHVSKDRTNATALSIPRDLIVDIPDCPTKQADGSTKVIPGLTHVRFNRSLGESGRDPGCTMRTIKENTGITVDHFMMADFNAVKTLTSAVGGVPVCLEHAVDDPDSKLKLPAGESTIEGEEALAFVRTRHSWGNQGDLDRIKVQQQFMASLMRKMSSGRHPDQPQQTAEAGRGGHQGAHRRHRHREGEHAQGRGHGAEEGADEEHHLHHGARPGQPGGDGQGHGRLQRGQGPRGVRGRSRTRSPSPRSSSRRRRRRPPSPRG